MKSNSIRTAFATLAVTLVPAIVSQTPSAQSNSATTSEATARPLLLEKNEGEQRKWRPEPGETDPGGFIIKVSPKNNGSRYLVLFTGDTAPGDAIPRHKHLAQDEILLIEKGTLHVRLGDLERDLHAGGMVFIPANTWVGAKNTGTETESDVAIFSAPGFEDHLRCESVLSNERATPISRREENQCDHLGHVVYQDRGEKDRSSVSTPADNAKPLLLEKNEGERRVVRGWPGHSDPGETFILKVDPKNGSSSHLVLLTADLAPGKEIEAHKHPEADEILFLQTGTARVHLGDSVRVVHAGATVFIPANTWISVDNIGNDAISLAAIFSAPGFEELMRDGSVREGEKNVPVSKAEEDEIEKKHSHAVIYKQP